MTAGPRPGAEAGGEGAPADRRNSLRRQLALMLALAVAPAGGLAVIDAARTYAEEVERARRDFLAEVALPAQRNRDAFAALRHRVETIAVVPAVRAFAPDLCDAALRDLAASSEAYALAVAVDTAGVVRCASRPDAVGLSFARDPLFLDFMSRRAFGVAAMPRAAASRRPVIAAFTPILRDGALVGAVTVSMRADFLDRLMAETAASGAPARSLFVDRDGRPFGESADAAAAAWIPPEAVLRGGLALGPTVVEWRGADGVERVAATAPLLDGLLWMTAVETSAELHDGLTARIAAPIAAPILTWIMAVGASYYAVERLVVRHLEHLSRVVRAYGRGRLSIRPSVGEGAASEIADLSEAMAAMAARLDERARLLRDAAETNRVLVLEVYHRVRNNLQMIASLLNLRLRRAVSAGESEALARIRGQIQALSLVHRQLERARDVRKLRLDLIAAELAEELGALRRDSGRPAPAVTLALERLSTTPDVATPFALFFDEAFSCLADCGATEIRVALAPSAGAGARLTLTADAAPCADPDDGFGLRLRQSLARQLGATLTETATAQGGREIALGLPGPGESAPAG